MSLIIISSFFGASRKKKPGGIFATLRATFFSFPTRTAKSKADKHVAVLFLHSSLSELARDFCGDVRKCLQNFIIYVAEPSARFARNKSRDKTLHLSSMPFLFRDELRLRHDIDISSRKSEGSRTNNRRVYQATGVGYHVSRLSPNRD